MDAEDCTDRVELIIEGLWAHGGRLVSAVSHIAAQCPLPHRRVVDFHVRMGEAAAEEPRKCT